MDKTDLIAWLHAEQKEWLSLLSQLDTPEMEIPGVNGPWSVKDLIAHLTVWHQDHVLCLGAATQGVEPPDPPWPLEMETTDAINAWIYERSKSQTVEEVLAENEQVFHELMEIVQQFPEDIPVEIKGQFRVVEFSGQRFSVGYFFDHFHEDHEADLRAWIEKDRD